MSDKQTQPNFDDVVKNLTNHIAMLSADNAMLNSIVKQQEKTIEELKENAE